MIDHVEPIDAAALADPARWVAVAAGALHDLGFTLVQSDRPGAPGGANLLVALRAAPSLVHFDPERIDVWVAEAGRGRRTTIDRETALPLCRDFAWGHVHVVDRLAVENRFLTFGGELRAATVDPALGVVRIGSPGPIVRWGGHSQGEDPLAGEIGAFFGRLSVRVDFSPGAEARLAATPAAILYAAFLLDAGGRFHRMGADPDHGIGAWLRAEAARLAVLAPDTWRAGTALLGELGLEPA